MVREFHCIVTPDYPGPIKNGGIGTHCHHLARYLKKLGHEVTIVFTGPFETGDAAQWSNHFKETEDLEFNAVGVLDEKHPWHMGFGFNRLSGAVAQFLESRSFNAIHFQEWRGNGFIAMQRRRTLGTLPGAVLTVTMHSSSEWIAEGGLTFRRGSFEHLAEEYCERYAVQHADIVLSPSRHMLEWAEQHGWKLPERRQVLPYLVADAATAPVEIEIPDELIFFGRLETRKGLEVFAEALRLLAAESFPNKVRKITFLGKHNLVGKDLRSKDFLADLARDLSTAYQITVKSDLDHLGCRDFLNHRPRALIVIPSLLDNYPFTVLECLQQGRRFIASRIGGIPEMVADSSCLFDPKARALASKIREKCSAPSGATQSAYSLSKTEENWGQLLSVTLPKIRQMQADDAGGVPREQTASSGADVEPKKVTICVPHFNHVHFLKELLESLETQTSNAFSVVVVDDGSHQDATETLGELSEKYQPLGWKFFTKDNGGIGHTRNTAARHADTEFLIFMDADNIAHPQMVETFLEAIENSECDCLTSYFLAFPEHGHPSTSEPCYGYMPIGPCLEAGLLENVYGDANFIIRKTAFDGVGGFTEDRGTSYEDWELLAKMALQGYELDVIPQPLFYYRHTEDGFSRATSLYSNHSRAIRPYMELLPDWLRRASRALVGSEAPTAPEGQTSITVLRSQIRKLEKQQAKLMSKLDAERAKYQDAKREIERFRNRPRGIRGLGSRLKKLVGKGAASKGENASDSLDTSLVKRTV